MANLTPNLGLFKYDPLTDQNEAFSFEQALNDNWDILDEFSENLPSGRNIGEIVPSTVPLTDAGLHLLDGSLISGLGSYADFVTYIANLYEDTKETLYAYNYYNARHKVFVKDLTITSSTVLYNTDGSVYIPGNHLDGYYSVINNVIKYYPASSTIGNAFRVTEEDHTIPAGCFCTEVNWQTAVTANGVCGKFVYNSTNNTVRLPKYSNKIYTSLNNTVSVAGNGMTLGLTDGTNNAGLGRYQSATAYLSSTASLYGANVGTTFPSSLVTPVTNGAGITTDSTKSGIIAKLSDITTALDGYYYIVVATSTQTDIQVDIDEIATDLNGKADVDLSNTSPAQSFKNNSIRWGMPDYANGISLAGLTTYTCPSDGWLIMVSGGAVGYRWIYRNSAEATNAIGGYGVANSIVSSFTLPVCKGEVYTFSGALFGNVYFYPAKGV